MKLWLSRQRDGSYMLTALRPRLCRVGRTEFRDWYVREGEPIGIRHLCAMGTKALFGFELEIGTQTRVIVSGSALRL